ncbi:hypothetical protein [Pseudomonas sp. LjRoot263]|uniref:hypothetical protein n=1 Tax=Pseudomonas sp. LjRoot263 TaxID=3342302 RepID=UPI003ED0E51C
MGVVYRDFLSEAKDFLSASPSAEIRIRSCISRGYYALYHSAIAHADGVHLPPVSSLSGPTHKNLRAFYIDTLYPDKALQSKMKRVGYSLKVLHETRCKADYQLGSHLSSMDADVFLQRCEIAIELVEDLEASIAA